MLKLNPNVIAIITMSIVPGWNENDFEKASQLKISEDAHASPRREPSTIAAMTKTAIRRNFFIFHLKV